jgi:hypothetical protein
MQGAKYNLASQQIMRVFLAGNRYVGARAHFEIFTNKQRQKLRSAKGAAGQEGVERLIGTALYLDPGRLG